MPSKKKAKRAKRTPPAKESRKEVGREARILCPECGMDVPLPASAQEGLLLECPECGCSLEVVRKGTRLTVQSLDRPNDQLEVESPEEEFEE